MKKRFTFSLIMGKRLFLRPKDNISCFELGFISLLIYFHLLNCSRVMIFSGFLLRVLSFHFYSVCFLKRVNFQGNLFKKIQLLNIKITEKLLWIHDSFSWEQSFVLGSSPLIAFWSIWVKAAMYSWVGCSLHKGIQPRDKGAEIWPMLHLHSCVSWHQAASTWRKECLFLILTEAFMHSWQPYLAWQLPPNKKTLTC